MLSIAIQQLLADRGKLFAALVGVIFSVVLVNVQGGLFLGLIQKAALLVDGGEADIWIGPQGMHNVDFSRDIPRRWVHRIRTVPGVRTAEPYVIGFANMTLPSGNFEHVAVIGVDPTSGLGSAWNYVEGGPQALLRRDGLVVDRHELAKLEYPRIGDTREIGGRRAQITGMTEGVMGFLVNPYVFTTLDRAADYVQKPRDRCSYFLVQVEPGANVQQVCAALRQRVPALEVMPRDEYSRVSVGYWLTRTGIGISFGAATLLGLLVGLVMVSQTLYAMVLDRLSEFGAIKAMGADEPQICRMLLAQALTLALLGSLAGLLITLLLQVFCASPRAPIRTPCWLTLGSCLLVSLICMVSSLLPYLRVRRVDPLLVLQS